MGYVVGLTGGIGSGKSTVGEAFARRGIVVIEADAIAHQLTGPGGAAVPRIAEAFGPEFVASDGSMDRARMRAQAFQDPESRRKLEGILHPMIREESERQISAAPSAYVVYVVPLLVESPQGSRRVDRVLVVDCEEQEQVARVVRRSGLEEPEVRRIMATQASRAERLARADDVLRNDGLPDRIDRDVGALHARYLALAQAKHSA